MRSRISEINIFPSFSLETEYNKLRRMFMDNTTFGKYYYTRQKTRPCLSYDDCLQALFLKWKLRGSFTSIEEMLFGLAISEDDFNKGITRDRLLDYIQFILNAVMFVDKEANEGDEIYLANDTIGKAIFKNSKLVANKLGAELELINNEEVYVVYKDDIATAVSEQNKDIEISIVEYFKIDNRGDLRRKAEILCTLAKKIEKLENALTGVEFGKLCSDTTFLLNNLGIRHCQNPNNKIEAKFMRLDDQAIEMWYDKTFNMILACLAVYPYIGYKKEINEVKKNE